MAERYQMVVFTNGCFDILHIGHLRLLEYCRSLGGIVVVGLNSDESIWGLKGRSRPINNQADRTHFLSSLRTVDSVVVFDEPTPLRLIERIRPDIIVKGGDYQPHEVVGHGLAEVKIFGTVEGYSTTRIIHDISHR